MNQQVLLASYKISYKITLCEKPHTTAEELILAAATIAIEDVQHQLFRK